MKALPVFLAAFLLAFGAWGQSTVRPLYVVVTSCGTAPSSLWTAGSQQLGVQDVNGNVCVNASVTATASITGFPGASPTTGTPIAVTTSAVTGTLPAGTVVVASNVGATNGAYCKLGATATTSDQLIPPNSWFAFTVGLASQLTCITSASITTVNMVGGAGLPTGSGGGGGGSGISGAVTIADGANVTQGAIADTAWSGSGSSTVVAALKAIYNKLVGSIAVTGTFWQATQPVSMATAPTTPVTGTFWQTTQPVSMAAALPAGTNLLGKVGIDQTTPGTTNAVSPQVNVGGTQTGQIGCGSSVVYDASTSGSTQLVALASSQKVYVCGYTIVAAGTVNVELDYGTGTACATGNTKLTPAYQLTAQVGLVDGSPLYRGLATIASNELCIKTNAAVAVQAVVYYTQF